MYLPFAPGCGSFEVFEVEPRSPLDLDAGFYWWACHPGCLPEGEPVGPFASAKEAIADARAPFEEGFPRSFEESLEERPHA